MKRPNAPLVACLLVAVARAASAQSDATFAPVPPHQLTIFAGATQSARLEATASPRTFGGPGISAALDYRGTMGSLWTVGASVGAGYRRLSPLDGPKSGTQQLFDGDVRASLMRRLSARSGFSVGLASTTNYTYTEHRYPEPTGRVSHFVFGATALGPAVAYSRSVGRGAVGVELSSPMIGMVSHPYSDNRTGDGLSRIRVATAADLRGVNGTLRYAPPMKGDWGMVYAYRFNLLDYKDLQPVRSASHSLSIGITRRLGGER